MSAAQIRRHFSGALGKGIAKRCQRAFSCFTGDFTDVQGVDDSHAAESGDGNSNGMIHDVISSKYEQGINSD